ncbi:MAG: phosphoribosylamine--glycine ligase [Candidatus Omnitrophica bacterium]|nr:phosphoribosylamine--glycine ligase [Candidatus Omnitrophota bacterium]
MNVLVVGGGGREHALVWTLAKSPGVKRLCAAPGNAGIADQAECVPISAGDIPALVRFAREHRVDLTVIGPEAPLVSGIVDAFAESGMRAFGPSRAASLLEGSKSFAKGVMQEAGVACARSQTFTERRKAQEFARGLGLPVVVKADGLAQGKGVRICHTEDEISQTLSDMMEKACFGDAGRKVVIEEYLTGEECSILALVDGHTCVLLEPSQDHKRLHDGDMGPNTGGMGAYSPVPFINHALQKAIQEEIFLPVVDALAGRGTLYRGVLYAGLMLTEEGPKVLEFNCRFGDPETQAVLPRLKSDLLAHMLAVCEGRLAQEHLEWDERAAVCVVAASGGYPGKYEKGKLIEGLERAAQLRDLMIFHSGTCRDPETKRLVTDGGRVLSVTGMGRDIQAARSRVYSALKELSFENMIYRSDISDRSKAPGLRRSA